MAFNGGSAQGPGGEGQLLRVGGCRSQWRVLSASHPGAGWPHLLTSAQRPRSASKTSALARPPRTSQLGPPPTHRPGHGTGQRPHRNLGATQGSVWPGKARGGRAATWGHGGTHRIWESTRCGPPSCWPPGLSAQTCSRPSRPRGASGLWDTGLLGHPRVGGAGRSGDRGCVPTTRSALSDPCPSCALPVPHLGLSAGVCP